MTKPAWQRKSELQLRYSALDACHRATELLKAVGFEFRYASMKSEACYYGLPELTDLIRIAAHKNDRGTAGLGKIIAKITFPINNGKTTHFPEIHVQEMVVRSIGWYIIRSRGVLPYTGRQPRYTKSETVKC